jgi:hypothetical protein
MVGTGEAEAAEVVEVSDEEVILPLLVFRGAVVTLLESLGAVVEGVEVEFISPEIASLFAAFFFLATRAMVDVMLSGSKGDFRFEFLLRSLRSWVFRDNCVSGD